MLPAIAATGIWLGLGWPALAQWNEDAELCSARLASPDQEIQHCTRAIRSGDLTRENMAVTFNNRGVAYQAAGAYDRAIADFNAALEITPDDRDFVANRAETYLTAGKIDSAIADFDTVIAGGTGADAADDKTMAQWLLGRGNAHTVQGAFAAAIADYDRAGGLRPDWALVHFNRGVARNRAGDDGAAMADYDKAIRLDPSDANALFNRGTTLLRLQRYDEAIGDLDGALARQPDFAAALGNRAIAREAVGDRDAALADYQRQWQLGLRPDWLAAKLRELGDKMPVAPAVHP